MCVCVCVCFFFFNVLDLPCVGMDQRTCSRHKSKKKFGCFFSQIVLVFLPLFVFHSIATPAVYWTINFIPSHLMTSNTTLCPSLPFPPILYYTVLLVLSPCSSRALRFGAHYMISGGKRGTAHSLQCGYQAIECFHVTSSKSNFYTIHSRKLVLSYFLEFQKLSLHPKFWADMEILSVVLQTIFETNKDLK